MCRDRLFVSTARAAQPGLLSPISSGARRSLLGWSMLLAGGLLVGNATAANPLKLTKKPAEPAKTAADSKAAAPANAEPKKPELLATINGEEVKRDELGRECLKRYGSEVLDSVVHKEMIADYCRKHDITVSNQEVEDEIERMAAKFKLPKEEWLKLLAKERNIKRNQYAHDIIWPTLALRKLAAPLLTVSKEEMDKAFDSQFGPAVKVRLIVMPDQSAAQQVQKKAAAEPENFAALARQHSVDSASASSGGLIQPIRRYLGDPGLERVVFAMKKDQISPVVPVRGQFVVVKCEGHLPASEVDRKQADPLLEDAIKEGKLHTAANKVFKDIEAEAVIQVIFGDADKQKQLPGVAAVINDHRVTIRELTEECIDRHGIEVLERMLDRKLLDQALRKRKLIVGQSDVDAEVARAALLMGHKKDNGEPDVEGWLNLVTRQQKLPVDAYLADSVWPSVALKKLVGEDVQISDADVKKGYEANYGPRARCRAIILSNQRKALEVWEKARDKSTLENFAALARQYSIEPNSSSLGGEVPPIQRHGGQPTLEKEAFGLKPGQISGVIQVGETFVILFCEGFTKPVKVEMAEARKHILEDLREKKQRIAMSQVFERLQDSSEIDNYLAGTLRHPKNPNAGSPADVLANPPAGPGSPTPKRR